MDSDGDGLINSAEAQLGTNPLNPDTDGDEMRDGLDGCPTVAEDIDGFQDGGGCPEPDNDLDGICDPDQTSGACTGSDTGQKAFFPIGHINEPALVDCRNDPEDYDSFKDSDGCPELDNDNDGHLDADDVCAGTDLHAGADGVLGSGEDQDNDGMLDPDEDGAPFDGILTSDDNPITYEDNDGILDNDGCYDRSGGDTDGDGYQDELEALHFGTRADRSCGTDWPSNLVHADFSFNRFDIIDLGSFIAPVRRVNTKPGDAGFDIRWDLSPGSNFANDIDIADLGYTIRGSRGYPPMLGGQFAFGMTCPFPP